MAADTPPPPAGAGSFFTRKLGPLPMWAWMLVALVAVYAVVSWRNAHSGATTQPDTSSLPANTDPAPITQFYDYVTVTSPEQPPAGGRTDAPGGSPSTGSATPPAGGSGGSGTTPPPKNPKPAPKPTSGAVATPKPKTITVTVAKYTTMNPPWNSTLSGIAAKEGYGGDWAAIWNDPANASLKSRRKQPNLIQPGDKIVVKPK